MSPIPIRKVNEELQANEIKVSQDFSILLPLLQPFFTITPFNNTKDKELVKKVWYASKTVDGKKIEVSASITDEDLSALKVKGLLEGEGRVLSLTDIGNKLLREAILNDEKSSFTKSASKQLISHNSWDFGKDVLVKMNDKEKFGAKYICVSKDVFKKRNAKSQEIKDYKIATRKENGNYKDMKDYTEDELIQVLHLAKKIIANKDKLSNFLHTKTIPVHRIKSFAEIVMKELNAR